MDKLHLLCDKIIALHDKMYLRFEELLDQGDQRVIGTLSQTLLVMNGLFPKDYWTLAHLGTAVWQTGNEDEGRRLLQSALALKSDYTWAQIRLAQLYLDSAQMNFVLPDKNWNLP